MDKFDAIALLLAAEKDPAILEQSDYAEARSLLDTDEGFAAWVASEREFYRNQDNLLDGFSMPEAARERIRETFEEVLIEEGELIELPGFGRNLLTLAAALAILFTGVATLMHLNKTTGTQPGFAKVQPAIKDLDTFRAKTAQLVAEGLRLDFRTEDLSKAVDYLAKIDAPVQVGFDTGTPAMGCAVYRINGAQVSLICMKNPNGQTVHLFTADKSILQTVNMIEFKQIKTFNGRETRAWQDEKHTYVLVAHDEGQKLGQG